MIPKPEPRDRQKRRRRRAEGAVVQTVRATCVERDGYCRIEGCGLGPCEGPSEWAHLGDRRRFRTVGMPAEERHTAEDSLIMCRRHHGLYDRGDGERMRIEPLTPRCAAGPMLFSHRGVAYRET